MKALLRYGWMAAKHWRQFPPKLTVELEAQGQLHAMLLEAEEQTMKELNSLRQHFIQLGLTPQQAHGRAWEIARQRYLFLPPEE